MWLYFELIVLALLGENLCGIHGRLEKQQRGKLTGVFPQKAGAQSTFYNQIIEGENA